MVIKLESKNVLDFDYKQIRKNWELKLNYYSEREQSLKDMIVVLLKNKV